MPHGYLVRGVPVERLVDATLDDRANVVQLGWATATEAGRERIQLEFPSARRDELRELCNRLAACLPRPRDSTNPARPASPD